MGHASSGEDEFAGLGTYLQVHNYLLFANYISDLAAALAISDSGAG